MQPSQTRLRARRLPGILVAVAMAAAQPASAGRSEEPDFKLGLAQATYIGRRPIDLRLHHLRCGTGQRGTQRGGVGVEVHRHGALSTLGRALIDVDPFAHISLNNLDNPYDTEVQVVFSFSMPTIRLIDSQWQVRSQLELLLFDGNGDGASATPSLQIAAASPLAPREARFMETGVSLAFGGSVYFGGPPVAPLGATALSAAAGGMASFRQHSSAATLPSHAWIGADVAWNTMAMSLGFKLSPHDSVQLRADLDITPVPEPATWALWLAGAAAGLFWRRRAT